MTYRLSLVLPEELRKLLRRASFDQNKSMAEIIREAIKKLLENDPLND